MFADSGNDIIQAPGYVVIRHEMIHEARVIPLDGRSHLPAAIRQYMGDSRGRWDGNTLVVTTTNLNGALGVGPNGGGTVLSDAARITERLTRVSPDVIQYEVTVNDPNTWTRPWTMAFPWQRDSSHVLFEFSCHEGNRALRHIPRLSSSRRLDDRRRTSSVMTYRERLRFAVRCAHGVGLIAFAIATLRAQTLTPEQRAALTRRIAAAVQQTSDEQNRAVSVPFVGVTTDGTPLTGLFPVRTTGVSTAPIRLAAEAFLDTLTAEQRRTIVVPVESEASRRWVATGLLRPDGLQLRDMTDAQRAAALQLLAASLSAAGLVETINVMRLNQSQVELTADSIPNDMRPHPFGQWSYWLSIMGSPHATEPWGWQIEGHHHVISYLVLGDQVVMTPTFMGAEPAKATFGQFSGTEALQAEQHKGWALFASLTPTQKATATIRMQKARDEGVAGAFQDNLARIIHK